MPYNLKQHFSSFFCSIGDEGDVSDALSRLPSITHKAVRYHHGLVSLIISAPDSNPLFKYYVRRYDDIFIFVQGDFYESPQSCLNEVSFARGIVDSNKIARIVSRMNGVFCGFIANTNTGEVFAFTDQFGFSMMYTCKTDKKVMLSSSIWPFITNKSWRGSINELAAEQILLFGFPYGNATAYENICVVKPATIKRVDLPGDEYCYRNIQRKSNTTKARLITASITGAMQNHFDDVQNSLSVSKFGLALSGGHDSRVVLNGMLNNRIAPECFIGFKGKLSTDAKNAIWTAKLGKCKHTVFDYAQLSEQESIDTNILLDGAETGNWSMALARQAAANSREVIYFGTSGDFISGGWRFDPDTFGNWHELAAAGLNADYEYGLPLDQFCTMFKQERGSRVIESYLQSYDKPIGDLRDVFLAQRLDEKNFRRIRTFMRGGYLYSTPVHLFHDRRVANVYLTMPYSLLHKQKAHIKMCSIGNIMQGIIPATNYPVPVLLEPQLIPLIKKFLPKDYVARYKNRFVKKSASDLPNAGVHALNIIRQHSNQVAIDIDRLEKIIRFDSRAQLISLRARYLANMLEPDMLCAQSSILGNIEVEKDTLVHNSTS